MQQTTYEATENAAREGAEVVLEVLKARSIDESQLSLAWVASSAMSSFAKLYQATSSREATIVSIISQSSPADAAEFRRLVAASLPSSPVSKALLESPAPKKLPKRSLAKSRAAQPSTAQ